MLDLSSVVSPTLDQQHNNNRFMALCPGLPGWAGTRRNTSHNAVVYVCIYLPRFYAFTFLHVYGYIWKNGGEYSIDVCMCWNVYAVRWGWHAFDGLICFAFCISV